jgi:hypothetical protein
LSYEAIQAKMNEIQKKLFDESVDEKESELLNIEYEKLVTELESTDEYKQEQAAALAQWHQDHHAANQHARATLLAELDAWPLPKRIAAMKRKPELKFLDMTHEQIHKKHVNEYKSLSAQNLSLDEARAIYASLPAFKKDQEVQLQFLQQVKEKIDAELSKPKKKQPPPIVAQNPPKFRPVPPQTQSSKSCAGESDNSGFLAELLRKRKVIGA